MKVEPQLDPPEKTDTPGIFQDADVFRRKIELGLPIRLREMPSGRWLLHAHDCNEQLGVDPGPGRIVILAALATICAGFDVTRPGFDRS